MPTLFAPYDMGRELDPANIPIEYGELPDDDDAVRLVVKDLNLAEYYILAKGMTVSWDRSDRLYLFRMAQAFWEGSSVPRASLGMPLIFEHIESLMPQIMAALFSDNPPFDVVPKGDTKPEIARAVRALVAAQLKAIGFEEQVRLGIKESLVYGTGIWKYGWCQKEGHQLQYKRAGVADAVSTGLGTVLVPNKKSKQLDETLEFFTYHEPWFERVHIRWLCVDPALREPDIRKAKYVIHRTYPDLTDMEMMRDQPGYNLPSPEYLASLFRPPREAPERSLLEGRSTSSVLNTGISSLDINMEFKAMPRWQDPSRDPNLQPLEVCEYTTDSKCISVLNRKLCIKNQPNPLGKINYLSINFADVIDSWYGLGVSQLLAGEQRLQQGIINSRLDELALRLSGTFLRTRGANTPTQQLRMRPGGIIDTDDAKGIQMIQYPPALVDAFTEVDASDSRAQRRTGANQLVTQGTAPSAGQLGRTSAGIQTANAALGARISYWMDQITTLMFVPALEAIMEMNQKYMPEDEIKDFFADELREAFSGDALDVKNGSFKFETLAGGKLKQRMSMMQIAPELMQFFQLQPVLEAIADQQMKVDWMQFIQTVLDATGWPGAQKFITKMTPQEIKAQQQKSQMMLQNSQIMLKHQAAMQEIEQKGKAQIGSNISKGIVDHQNPETKANALSKLYEMYMNEQAMAQGDQDAEGEGEAGQTGGEEGAGEEGGEP